MPVCYRGPVTYPAMPKREDGPAKRRERAGFMGVSDNPNYRSPEQRGRLWGEDEKDKLKSLYHNTSMDRLKEVLSRTAGSISHMASLMGLRKK